MGARSMRAVPPSCMNARGGGRRCRVRPYSLSNNVGLQLRGPPCAVSPASLRTGGHAGPVSMQLAGLTSRYATWRAWEIQAVSRHERLQQTCWHELSANRQRRTRNAAQLRSNEKVNHAKTRPPCRLRALRDARTLCLWQNAIASSSCLNR